MLMTRTPLRISLGGGGTDLPSYSGKHGGFVISTAITRHVYVGISRTFNRGYVIRCGGEERTDSVANIQHAIVREALKLHETGPVEIFSVADVPPGTGLGSSGSFTVGLLHALYAWKRQPVSATALALEACRIEIELLQQPVGMQDPFIAAVGGITCFEFAAGGGPVTASPLAVSQATLQDLQAHLMLFFTGHTRNAAAVLQDQKARCDASDPAMLENLHVVKETGHAIRRVLERGDTRDFAALMHQHWLHKQERSAGMSTPAINRWYQVGMANGALGGKLVGAGGGGFLLFYAEDTAALRKAMAHQGLEEVSFSFSHGGSAVLVQD